MSPSRREKIEAMLIDEPRDSFLRYALAMEFDKEGRHDESLQLFAGLMRDEPPYVAAFFMSAQQLTRLDRVDEARTALRDGIEAARRQGDAHAAGEMSEFLTGLGAYGE
jgi:tetratricopeptide (TPR) repeat protein